MKKPTTLLLFATLALLGCGGGGSGNSTPSPFAGQWAGTWNSAALDQNGTVDITIATNGAVTGTGYNNTIGRDTVISGRIDNSGQVSGTSQFPGEQATSINGTLTINDQGHLVGNLVQRINNTNYDVSFDLTEQ